MTIQQLNYAIAVFRAGSINRAAQKLYIAQPNLSNAIKSLEDELNITLFQRTPRGMEPTRAGEKFILRAMELVAQFDAFESLYASRQADVLSLSITTARSSEFSNCIAAFCNRFTERHRRGRRGSRHHLSEQRHVGLLLSERPRPRAGDSSAASEKVLPAVFRGSPAGGDPTHHGPDARAVCGGGARGL